MRTPWIRSIASGALGCALALAAGCAHIGPQTVAVDRFDYSTAIADSWKQQTLLNIVKLRYMDLPVFVDVSSIVAGYSLQTGVTVNGVVSSRQAIQGNYAGVGGQAIYTDRPTITYVPLTGEKFLRGLMTPIEPKSIFFMIQSGYAADFILGLTVEGLNGVRNRSLAAGVLREADPEFVRALQLLREVQAAGAVGMRVETDKAKGSTAVLFFRRSDVTAEIAAKSAEVRRLLNLSAEPQKFVLTYGAARGAENELAVNSRSMLQVMTAFASYVDVPSEDVERHRTVATIGSMDGDTRPESVRVYSGAEKPAGAFAAVPYHGHWFWIDDGDFRTKRAITAIMFFFTLADTGAPDNLPLVTIPAQ
jgi:hypothetical protein